MEPNLVNEIHQVVSGESLKNALDFAEYLKASDMVYTGVHNEVHYKGKCACYIYINTKYEVHSPWSVWTEGSYTGERADVPMNGRMKEIAWASTWHCLKCGNKCSPGHRETIFGREFDNLCNAFMMFRDPGGETLECVKKLVEMRKRDIDDMGKE